MIVLSLLLSNGTQCFLSEGEIIPKAVAMQQTENLVDELVYKVDE